MPMNRFEQFLRDENGATSIEYALISAGIGMTVIAGVDAAGKAVNNAFAKIAGELDGNAGLGEGLSGGTPPDAGGETGPSSSDVGGGAPIAQGGSTATPPRRRNTPLPAEAADIRQCSTDRAIERDLRFCLDGLHQGPLA